MHRQQRHLLGGCHVQHVHAPMAGFRQRQEPAGRRDGGLGVAPLGMAGRLGAAGDDGVALPQPGLVLGMHSNPSRAVAQHTGHVGVVGDEQDRRSSCP